MPDQVCLDNVTIVLVKPHFPENIGAAARAMLNMGLKKLVVVSPPNFDSCRINRMATHEAADVVENIKVFDDLNEALAPFSYIIGTTARQGRQRRAEHAPARLAEKLITISKSNSIAVLFGPEDRGLQNQETRLCHELVNIPTDEFSSLNLAQAVMIICYEIFTAGRRTPDLPAPRMAARHELDGMYEQLSDILVRISYLSPENPDYWMGKLRNFFNRLQLGAGEVSIIRGICRQVNWFGQKNYQDGSESSVSEKK